MGCSQCGRGMESEGVCLLRQNPVGEVPSLWRCTDCLEGAAPRQRTNEENIVTALEYRAPTPPTNEETA